MTTKEAILTSTITTVVLSFTFLLAFWVIADWEEPTSEFPNENAASPINVSDKTQFKEGALGVGGVFQAESGVKVGGENTPCTEETEGVIRYKKDNEEIYFCNGRDWALVDSRIPCGGSITDSRDGQTYETVQIGDQCWMAENMNVGVRLDSASDTPSDNETIEKWCYDNDSSNCDTYGGLYDFNEARQYSGTEGTQGICPEGWHVPTDSEWYTLDSYLSESACGSSGWDCAPAAPKLAGDVSLWRSGDLTSHADFGSSGFIGVPGGYRIPENDYRRLGSYASSWTSSLGEYGEASDHDIYHNNTNVSRATRDQAYGLSVRCIRN